MVSHRLVYLKQRAGQSVGVGILGGMDTDMRI
jgi:hypothetical protein